MTNQSHFDDTIDEVLDLFGELGYSVSGKIDVENQTAEFCILNDRPGRDHLRSLIEAKNYPYEISIILINDEGEEVE